MQKIRVVELANLYPAPLAGLMLRELGAQVFKVEAPPGGPGSDAVLRPETKNETVQFVSQRTFAAINEGKHSIVVNFSDPGQLGNLHRLISTADVVILGFRPESLLKYKLDARTLHSSFPAMVVCSITGYGLDGPLSLRAGHDINYLARSGVLGMGNLNDGIKSPLPFQAADVAGGTYPAVMRILAALFERNSSGRGALLDISMTDCSHSLLFLPQVSHWATGGTAPVEGGQFVLTRSIPCYAIFATKDGRYMVVGALEAKYWRRAVDVLGLEEKYADASYQYGTTKRKSEELMEKMKILFASRTFAEWTEIFDAVDAMVDPVLTPEEAAQSPQFQQRKAVRTIGPLHLPITPVGRSLSGQEPPNIAQGAARIEDYFHRSSI